MEYKEKHRIGLGEYYKKVFICLICKEKYGSDKIKSDNKICPVCELKMRDGNGTKVS